jgi:hypothetical protein
MARRTNFLACCRGAGSGPRRRSRAESEQSRRQESGSGAGGGKPPCASRGSWKESKKQHAPIKPNGSDAHGRTRGWIFRGSAALARVSSLAKLSRAVVRVTRMSELAPGCPFRWRRGKDLRWLPGGLAQIARTQPFPRQPPLRSPQKGRDDLFGNAEFLGHFPSRVGPLAPQPVIHPRHFLCRGLSFRNTSAKPGRSMLSLLPP